MATKYDALGDHLAGLRGDRLAFSFGEIENLLGFPLPKSKRYPAWWSNNPSNNTMTRVWLDAGFETEQVDTGAERLVFRRARRSGGGARSKAPRPAAFPGYGCMAGTVDLESTVDLTEPADPAWGKVYD